MKLIIGLIGFFLGTSIALAAPSAVSPGQADFAALTLAAPIIVIAEVDSEDRLSNDLSPGLAAGHRRHLVSAHTLKVLTAPGYVPRKFEYLVDMPTDSRGRPAKLKGLKALVFLQPGRIESQLQLVRPWGQVAWAPDRESYVRQLAVEAAQPGARAFKITGLRQAFHVRGSVPGESESQIFVDTATGAPIALVVLARPEQQRQLSVATGDIIDEAAASVKPGSLLWYQLACHLPPELPESSTTTLDPADARAVGDDYRFALDQIGRCDRVYPF